MTQSEARYIAIEEASRRLNVPIRAIRYWDAAGMLEGTTRPSNERAFRSEAVDALCRRTELHQAMFHSGIRHPPDPQRLKVLIVEDDLTLLRIYAMRIETWPMSPAVDTAKNGFEALIKIGISPPDLLITDLVMPDMDGQSLIAAIRRINELEPMKIVVISGLSQDDTQFSLSCSNQVSIYSKPVAFVEIQKIAQEMAQTKALPLSQG